MPAVSDMRGLSLRRLDLTTCPFVDMAGGGRRWRRSKEGGEAI